MPKNKLFDDDSEEEVNLKTENEYAKKYDRWREKEELHKLEQKYGSKPSTSDASGSDSEEESDEPPDISEEVETQFLKTLSLLKTKDPRIYDSNYKFFNEKLEKRLVKKNILYNICLNKEKSTEVKKVTFTDSDDDDDDPNIFTIEKKAEIDNSTTKHTEDRKLKDYLIGKVDHIDQDVEKDLAPLKSLWSDPKLNDGEAFLRDYILNKRYLDEDASQLAEQKVRDDEDLEADEKTVEEQGKFERAYNFRFEEPDDEYLKRYPRTMNYIRPKDDRRSRKRAEIRERKEQEKTKKMEEIARLKSLKLKEIQEKIAKIKEVTGNEELAFEEADIEGDFDPEEHDRRMKAIFDEEYYGEADDQKPVFPDLDDELEIENWEKFNEHQDNENIPDGEAAHCEDEDFNMDADYNPKAMKENLVEELKRNQNKKRRNRKRKSKLAEILAQEKPKFAPQEEKSYAEYMEEYYKMDCEDIIADLPTRFKYREVVPNDYGLTVEEILLADDKELTQWVPLKKIVRYRPENIEKSEVNTYKQKAADERLKKKILPSLFKDLPDEPEIVVPLEETILKKKKNKKKKSHKTQEPVPENNDECSKETITNEKDSPKKKKKKSKRNKAMDSTSEVNTNEQSTSNNQESCSNNEKKTISKAKEENKLVHSNTDEENKEENKLHSRKNKHKMDNSTITNIASETKKSSINNNDAPCATELAIMVNNRVPSVFSKTYVTPRRPFEKARLDQELKIIGEYGLRNKREVWRVKYTLARIRKAARELLTLEEKDPKRLFEGNALLRRLVRIGVLDEKQMKLDYVLGLKIEDFLERRLQTQVFKAGLAKSIHHARILIRQRHIRVRKQVVNIPSFIVRLDSGKHIDFSLKSPFGGGRPGRVKRKNLRKGQGGGAANDEEED
ncbi:unnamed protein product [Leptosia nina]